MLQVLLNPRETMHLRDHWGTQNSTLTGWTTGALATPTQMRPHWPRVLTFSWLMGLILTCTCTLEELTSAFSMEQTAHPTNLYRPVMITTRQFLRLETSHKSFSLSEMWSQNIFLSHHHPCQRIQQKLPMDKSL